MIPTQGLLIDMGKSGLSAKWTLLKTSVYFSVDDDLCVPLQTNEQSWSTNKLASLLYLIALYF
jgi:hypothetical protein